MALPHGALGGLQCVIVAMSDHTHSLFADTYSCPSTFCNSHIPFKIVNSIFKKKPVNLYFLIFSGL